MSLVKLTYVTGPDKPCNVSGEVRPPEAVDDVCTCGEVSMMSSGENCWSFVSQWTTLWIPPPKATILLEEVLGVAQECSIYSIGESWGTVVPNHP